MANSFLEFKQESGIGILTISRTEARNALNSLILEEINVFLDSIQDSKVLRVLIITGAGTAFIAGADIAEMQKLTKEEGYVYSKTGQETLKRIMNIKIPVIAAVNGYALGGGLEIAMACDIRIASSNAKFGMPEVGLGLIPGYGGTQLLLRLVGPGDAMKIILSGQMIDAQEALRIRLVQQVVEPEKLIATTKDLALTIAEKSKAAVTTARKNIRQGAEKVFEDGLETEAEAFSEMFGQDAPEGMKAFLEKRKAKWKDV